MRTFNLVRKEDVSGISGTGVVAEGIEWTNGRVSMCWLGTYHIIEDVDSIHVIEAVHGHNGRTVVEWCEREAS